MKMIAILIDRLSLFPLNPLMSYQMPKLSFGNHQDVLIEPREKLKQEDLKLLLSQYGLKITNQRLVLLEVLNSGPKFHMTAHDILLEARKTFPHLGEATVYRFLSHLTKKGVISEVSMGNSSSRYELKSRLFHYHISCIRCGKIIEFKNKTIENTLKKIVEDNHFTMHHHSLELYIICDSKHCQSN